MKIKNILSTVGFVLTFSNVYAADGLGTNCEDANAAKAYAADFNVRANSEIDKGKVQEKLDQKDYEILKDRIITAGIWNEGDARTYMLSVTSTVPELKELEASRAKAAKELKTLQFALIGLPVASGGDVRIEHRAVCIIGQMVMSQLFIMNTSATKSWEVLNQRIILFGKEKGISGF